MNQIGIFLLLFLNFLGILQLRSGKNGTWNDFLFFFSLSRPDLARNEAKMTFFDFFFNFFLGMLHRRSSRNGTQIEKKIKNSLFFSLSRSGLDRN